jgi:hypothetical protein
MSAIERTQPNERAVAKSDVVEEAVKAAAYTKPRLQKIGEADALLDILGPAQAFYGRTTQP